MQSVHRYSRGRTASFLALQSADARCFCLGASGNCIERSRAAVLMRSIRLYWSGTFNSYMIKLSNYNPEYEKKSVFLFSSTMVIYCKNECRPCRSKDVLNSGISHQDQRQLTMASVIYFTIVSRWYSEKLYPSVTSDTEPSWTRAILLYKDSSHGSYGDDTGNMKAFKKMSFWKVILKNFFFKKYKTALI